MGRVRAMAAITGSGLLYGCDYNPEQWDRTVWREDVALMAEAGVNIVAINIFGWSQLEPREGEWDFSALDEVIELLHAHGIGVNLATGTASPPPWVPARYPETLPVVVDGTRRFPGGRQAFCPSSPVYRRLALRLTEQVARRYGAHPAVELWHVSNELGCHNSRCYCAVSAEDFRRWLRQRYGTLTALNDAWGTTFWSQRVGEWEEIDTPKLTLSTPNPGQVLDFKRFSSEILLDHYRAEAEVIRAHSRVPITTNLMVAAHRGELDYWTWAPHMDLVANDHYLDHRLEDPVAELAFCADVTRGLAGGDPWFLMEHSTGAVNWQPVNLAKEPGEMARHTLAQVARGADAACYFQWRASRQGAERFHSALVPHAGTDSPKWREVVDLGQALRRLAPVAGSRVRAEVALLFSWESLWAVEGEGLPTTHLDYLERVHAVYGALRAEGHTVDVVPPGADLSGYRLIVVPTLYLVSDEDAERITAAVEAGAHAVVTFFSGISDESERVRLGGYPGAFRDLVGVRVTEFAPQPPERRIALDDGSTARLWLEDVVPTTARAHVRVAEGPWAGTPVVTSNHHGAGRAWYVATVLEPDAMRGLVREATASAGVRGAGDGEVEVVRRVGPEHEFVFVINHGSDQVEVPGTGTELLTGRETTGSVMVPAREVRVLQVPRHSQGARP